MAPPSYSARVTAADAPTTSRNGMPAWIPRLLGTVVAVIVVIWAAFNVLKRLRALLILLLISLFLSVALEPGVNFLAGRGWRRGLATGLMFLLVLLSAGLFIGLMVPLVIDQTVKFVDKLPSYVDQASEFAQRFGVDFSSERIQEAVGGLDDNLQRIAGDVAGSVFGVGQALVGTIFQLLTIGLFTFYMTADGPRFRRNVCSVLPPQRQMEVLRVWEIAI